jgi:hypothetical protein
MLMPSNGGLAFLVEEAGQAANLKLAVEKKIPRTCHLVALVQTAENW